MVIGPSEAGRMNDTLIFNCSFDDQYTIDIVINEHASWIIIDAVCLVTGDKDSKDNESECKEWGTTEDWYAYWDK